MGVRIDEPLLSYSRELVHTDIADSDDKNLWIERPQYPVRTLPSPFSRSGSGRDNGTYLYPQYMAGIQ
jgi:hypothetical protein